MADDIARGSYAARLLDDPMFQEVFATIEADCFARWHASGAQQTAEREKIYDYMRALGMVRQELGKIRDNGVAAEARNRAEAQQRAFNALNR